MRRKYLVDRRYQIGLILRVVALVVAATVVSSSAAYLLADREVGTGFFLAHRDTGDIRRMLLPVIAGAGVATFVVFAALSVFIVLRISHRIVGPKSRLQGAVDDLAKGRLVPFGEFRRGDVLKGLDDSVNHLAGNLAVLEKDLKGSVEDLRREVGALRDGEVDSAQIERVRGKVDDLEKVLGFFSRG